MHTRPPSPLRKLHVAIVYLEELRFAEINLCKTQQLPPLVAEVDPAARPALSAAFDIRSAEQLLRRAFEEVSTDTPTASTIKNKMLVIDPAFDERNYGCRSFRDFLAAFPSLVKRTGRSGGDITVQLLVPNA